MSEPFLSEIKMMAFNYAPRGWAQCNGQIMPISQNQALFSLLGTTFGGDGRTTYALPNLQGRTPIHVGNGHTLGQAGGEPTHTLAVAEIPAHAHAVQASTAAGDQVAAANHYLGPANQLYGAPTSLTTLVAATVGQAGGQAHPNMQPYLAVNFCIALQGIYPSRS